MRTIKRLTATFLSLLMVMMMIVPVHAAESYSITITNDQDGHTYEAYQIFAGTVDSDAEQGGNDPGPVLSNITWSTALEGNAETILTALKNSSNDALKKRFASVETSEASAVAAALQGATTAELEAFADIINGYLGTTPTGSTSTKISNAYTISGLPAGYYLVKDKENAVEGDPILATKYIIQVLGNVEMQPKSTGDIPTVEKKVQEEDYTDDNGYGVGFSEVADHEIGETFTFKLIGSIPTDISGYDDYTYIFHDTMSEGLSLAGTNGDFKVYLSTDTQGTSTAQVTSNYSVSTVTTDSETGDQSFDVSVDLKAIEMATTNFDAYNYIIVTYSAQLNNNAVIGSKGNPNEVYLEFSNNPTNGGTGNTEKQYAIVYAWKLGVDKVDGDSATKDKMAGVKFVLLNSDKSKVATVSYSTYYQKYQITGWKDLGATDYTQVTEWANDTVMTTVAGVNLIIEGLDDDTYYLHEIETLTGYNLLDAPVKLEFESTLNHASSYDGTNAGDMVTGLLLYRDDSEEPETCNYLEEGLLNITIENHKGTLLPETGGMGTTIFYIVGGLLVVGAGVVLIVRLRMRSSDSDHTDE